MGKMWTSVTWCCGISSRKETPKLSVGCINFGVRGYRKKNYPVPTSHATEAHIQLGNRFIELSERCHKQINADAVGWWKDEVRA